ncbi:MAG TPA: NADH-quinone oxidoreductase subunit N, partial [Xanthobacteraceae bacterium]|nr:NADH-quinone oxidoreductase subunit N [Xanthobacteraceae bacterium]
FFGKLYVFMAAIDAGLPVLAVIGVLTSVVGAYYYLRIVKVMYFDEAQGAFDRPIGGEVAAVLVVCAVAILFFIIWPGPLLNGADAVAATLFPG